MPYLREISKDLFIFHPIIICVCAAPRCPALNTRKLWKLGIQINRTTSEDYAKSEDVDKSAGEQKFVAMESWEEDNPLPQGFVTSSKLRCCLGCRVPLQALKANGPAEYVRGLETDNTDQNLDFWQTQTIRCYVNPTTGVPEWNWTGIVKCELRGCNITEEMQKSPFLKWKRANYKGRQINISNMILPAYSGRVEYQCPNGNNASSGCGKFTYTPQWFSTCGKKKNILSPI